MVDVFLTIDTEAWPFSRAWPAVPLPDSARLSRETANYLYGTTAEGEYGLTYQLQRLNAHRLNATFFIEALSAQVLGRDEVSKLIELIDSHSQEAQLQIHTEWLGELAGGDLPRRPRQFLHRFSFEEQCRIIAHGLANLRGCGARNVVALRAGNFGADINTLRAAASNGLQFDSSLNRGFLGAACGLSALGTLLGPKQVEGIVEVPVSYFCDFPRHMRNAQLCACSFAEIRDALLWASHDKWPSFCIVLHTFELVKRYDRPGDRIAPHPLHIARFESLCAFLADNRDKFRTTHFRDYVPSLEIASDPRPMRSNLLRTLHRYGEQAVGQPLWPTDPTTRPVQLPLRSRYNERL